MSHIERRLKEKEEIKNKILDAAYQIAEQEGWNSLTIRKIADKIEYTPPIVYEYFDSKEQLIHEIVENGFKTLHNELAAAIKFETDSKAIINKAAMVQCDFAINQTRLYQLMFSLEKPIPNEEMQKIFEQIDSAFLNLISDKSAINDTILSWICLITGTISLMIKLDNVPSRFGKLNRDTFARIISRFVDNL